jgi:hypothetical protein
MQPTAYWVKGSPLPVIKQSGHEVGHSPPSTSAFKNVYGTHGNNFALNIINGNGD